MRRAVIDVGSNSVLLVVAELQDDQWVVLHESSEVTSLGAGTKETGLLSEEGMTRTLQALARAFATAGSYNVEEPIAAATMAARIARNTPDFLIRAHNQGTPVFVLSGDDEAQLGFQAVADDPLFLQHHSISIIDVGGQSTEIVTAERTANGWNVLFRNSFPIGTLALRGGALKLESPGVPEVISALAEIDDLLMASYQPHRAGMTIALGATGTNLVTIREQMAEWDPEKVHGAHLGYDEVSRAVERLMPLTDAQRAAIVGMEKGREKTLHIGALILERCMNLLKVENCAVSVRGWRHALLEGGMPSHFSP